MPEERVSSSSTTDRGSGNGFLYFAIGALIVAVAVLGWMFYGGGFSNNSSTSTDSANSALERSADAIGNAADRVGDAANNAASRIPAPAPQPAQPAQPAPNPSPAPTNPG